jgi:hypothetical protein
VGKWAVDDAISECDKWAERQHALFCLRCCCPSGGFADYHRMGLSEALKPDGDSCIMVL